MNETFELASPIKLLFYFKKIDGRKKINAFLPHYADEPWLNDVLHATAATSNPFIKGCTSSNCNQ
jgi:hypothetical protein